MARPATPERVWRAIHAGGAERPEAEAAEAPGPGSGLGRGLEKEDER